MLPACLPNRFVIDLAGTDGVLLEKRVLADKDAPSSAPKIALIDVNGLIAHTADGGLFANAESAVDETVARFQKAEADPAVKAVILRVNSPGGTVAASETLYQEIRAFRERSKKPVIASMAEVAASGGYYIALAADRVLAQESSITGSVGVIMQTINISKGLSFLGIESRAVKSGPMKDLANPLEPIREEQYAILQATVDDFYSTFRSLVRDRRPGIASERFDALTDGRIFTGRQALDAGLVDACGGLRDAFSSAKALSKIDRAQVIKYHPDGRTPMSPYALGLAPGHPAANSEVQLRLPLPGAALPPGFYYLWTPDLP